MCYSEQDCSEGLIMWSGDEADEDVPDWDNLKFSFADVNKFSFKSLGRMTPVL